MFKALFCLTTWKHVDTYVKEHFELPHIQVEKHTHATQFI